MDIPQLEDLGDVSGKSVLVRSDLNVPLQYDDDLDASIIDPFRITSSLPTLDYLIKNGARVTVCSHLGRPKGVPDPRYLMAPVRNYLKAIYPEIEVMENVRFNKGEEANDPEFVQFLIAGQDLYVNDAFGVSHRSHASVVGPPKYLKSAAGRLLSKEVNVLSGLLEAPKGPFVAIIGGAKVSDKIALIRAIEPKVDKILIGGAMAFTFLAAMGHSVGDSLFEVDLVEECKALLAGSDTLVVPIDFLGLQSSIKFGRGESGADPVSLGEDVPSGFRGLDIGPKSIELFIAEINHAATILWNGPMGVFEDDRFSRGTLAIANAVAESGAFSVVGGGDSAAAIDAAGLAPRISHLSTGGGASLELLEKGDLPGLAALRHGLVL
ncbi:phosphoglycerate kinase [Acidithrix ferrooxidans]|uniref:Phosphoglycerate kinase n=1 Tax=Acidithrix ferrooxidans TaxID=1280514 RepID=A0A0D8HMA9_9ACTN|nr:phosphoglycerate kinase [Acidithrix ferrooxidans]KJF18241.1 phosphoglycerate kinase [Acidithrix ferrooxidans]